MRWSGVRDPPQAPRGSLAVHALVPGSLKGTPRPPMQRRCDTIAAAMEASLRSRFAAARPRRDRGGDGDGGGGGDGGPRWLLQESPLTKLSDESQVW